MSYRTNLFSKMVILILIMLVPVVLLYWYSNHKTTAVLRDELNQSNSNQLEFFQNQVNSNIELLSSWPNLLIHDPDIASFRRIFAESRYFDLDAINLVKRIQNKLSIQESSSNWATKLYLYSPSLGRVISERDARTYDKHALKESIVSGWDVHKIEDGQNDRFMFSWITVSPYGIKDPAENAETIIKLEFDSDNIRDMLDKFKGDGRHDPFYFREETGVIYNRTSDRTLTDPLIKELSSQPLKDVENRTVVIGNEPYMVNSVKSSTTGWYLVDYMPLSDILKPIHQSNILFYSSMICLLLMSSTAAYLLYVQVQVPVKQLIRGFQRLKQEDYSVRIEPKGRNEFSFLSERFNSMVEKIQQLFEHVYLEQIHVREARLKQLQSQINPHFFYNCFSFITSMAKLKRVDAVVAMSHNLSRYYRYTTRQERDLVPLSEEIEFVTNYLEIQRMRMERIHYTLDLPEDMLRIEVSPLIVQPLVENAVIHGIEADAEAGEIRVSGEQKDGRMLLIVEDDGQGMTQEEREALLIKLAGTMDQEMGCGLWNVNQRLQLKYGEKGGLHITESDLGGVRVVLSWPVESKPALEEYEE
ncbi:sensor histidine kinase [Paenibacillus silvae]|nr:histidine kinase [Paenibacillus silvae]MCK6074155.1 histidine kinase [Paenibacillus silvae]MCK6148367.1 histidine kinase [Paenibacillus silvae]MCK6266667.1 histidine kinase [Paenibacillus silvae]